MSTPNPLAPQGSLLEKQAKSKSSLQIMALIVGLHVVVLGGFLILGCKREELKNEAPLLSDSLTNLPPSLADTNFPALGGPVPANGLPAGTGLAVTPVPLLATSAVMMPPSNGMIDPAPPATPAGAGSEYKVQKGDIAYNLAKKQGISLKALKEANPNVDLGKLKVGQTIRIPGGGEAKPGPVGASSGAAEVSPSGETMTYTVKGGDNLTKIAKKHGTTIKAIRAANGLKSNDIKVGQKLKVPVKAAAESAPTTAPVPVANPITVPSAAPLILPK